MDPRTLAQIVGAPAHPSPLERAALVVIDAQQEYVDGALPLAGIGPAVAEIGRLLALARRRAVPVIHVLHHGKAGGPLFDPATRFAAPITGLEPAPGEAVVVKGQPNAFAATDLDWRLRALGRIELILVGFATHMCVDSTARAALDLGWRSTVVASACATRNLPDPLGGEVAAARLHQATLTALADRFAVVVPDSTVWV